MALCSLHFRSQALQKHTAATVILPEANVAGPFAVLYLLHGLTDDHSAWQRRSSIERYAENLPLIIVMPDGGRGFYTDAAQGFAYEQAIIGDLIPFVDSRFRTIATRAGRCIGGLSMGGYGAMKLALKHPDLFASAHSHSGALFFGERDVSDVLGGGDEWRRVFGASARGSDNDLFALAERADKATLPQLRIDCGVDDFLIEHNRAFHAHLDTLQIAHEYDEYPGGHNWAYWDTHVQTALGFHAKALRIA